MTDLAWMRPKLAELVGGMTYAPSHAYRDNYTRNDDGTLLVWRPDEDVAQLIRCLEAVPHYNFSLEYDCDIGGTSRACRLTHMANPKKYFYATAATWGRAGCLAIAAALGWNAADQSSAVGEKDGGGE